MSFRDGFRDGESHRFLASCWVIVEAPRGTLPSVMASRMAVRISCVENPACEKNSRSSAATAARARNGETVSGPLPAEWWEIRFLVAAGAVAVEERRGFRCGVLEGCHAGPPEPLYSNPH